MNRIDGDLAMFQLFLFAGAYLLEVRPQIMFPVRARACVRVCVFSFLSIVKYFSTVILVW